MSRYKQTTGYIIHIRDFSNTSLIIEFYSKDYGLIHIIAKGIKKNKKLKPQIQLFCLIKLQFFGTSSLKTLSQLDQLNAFQFDQLITKTAGFYLNELLRYSLSENHRDDELFQGYQSALNQLGEGKLSTILRGFEKCILKYNGHELNVGGFKNQADWLTINDTSGIYCTTRSAEKLCTVEDLSKFIKGDRLEKSSQKRINQFMQQAINSSLSYRKIYSRDLLKSITAQTPI